MNLGLASRTALVCGGSSGLGYAIARLLLEEGCRVAINGRSEEKVEAARRRLQTIGPEVQGYPADVSDPAAVAGLVARAEAGLGAVDILVCNAGGPPPGPFGDQPAEAWEKAIALNLLSTVHLCRAAAPGMRRRRWGRILCLTSVMARQPGNGLILSTTARAGVLGFAKALSDELAVEGVTVNVLCPGYIATERLHSLAESRGRAAGLPADEILTDMVAAVPARRIGTPEEFAAMAVFLASEPARYITGTVISVDGGLTRSIV